MSNVNDAGGNSGSRGTSTDNEITGTNRSSSISSLTTSSSKPLGMTSGSDTGHQTGEGVLALLRKFGIDEAAVNSLMTQWRGQLSDKVSSKIQEGDLLELLDSAREMAKSSGSKLKSYSQANPAMFYSGVVAIMAGAGLLAAAAKNADVTVSDENNDRGL